MADPFLQQSSLTQFLAAQMPSNDNLHERLDTMVHAQRNTANIQATKTRTATKPNP